MDDFSSSIKDDANVAQWLSARPHERANALKKWITEKQNPLEFDFWINQSPQIEQKYLRDFPQNWLVSHSSGYSFPSHETIPTDYIILLEAAGFDVLKKLSTYHLNRLLEKYNEIQNIDILKICKAGNVQLHMNVLRAMCSSQIKKERFTSLWNVLDWERMVKTNGANVILALAELGENAYKGHSRSSKRQKTWEEFVKIIAQTPGAKTLVKRALNFPQKDDWINKIYLYAAGLEIWGGECVVPSRKPTLSQSFKESMGKLPDSHIHKPPTELVEFVEHFLLRDYLISEIATKEDAPVIRRKI